MRGGPRGRAARPPPGREAARRGRRCGSGSASGHARSPTTSRSSATAPTASRASRAGVRSRPRPCSPATSTSTAIPDDVTAWDVDVRGAAKLAATLADAREAAELFLDLATLRTDADVGHGRRLGVARPRRPELDAWAKRLGAREPRGPRRAAGEEAVRLMEALELSVGPYRYSAIADGPRDGELVLLVHGFPETSYEWRHQVATLGGGRIPRRRARSARVHARDARPGDLDQYRIEHLVADVVGLRRRARRRAVPPRRPRLGRLRRLVHRGDASASGCAR